MKNILIVKNLNKESRGTTILEDVSFKLAKGSVTAVLGDSLQSKTELLKIIVGLEKPDKDSEVKLGTNKIAYKPKEDPLYNDLTVYQNLSFFYDLRKGSKSDKESNINEILEIFDIEEYRNTRVKKLFEVYKRRVSIATALVGNPELIVIDIIDSQDLLLINKKFVNYIKGIAKNGTSIIYTPYDNMQLPFTKNSLILHKTHISIYGKLSNIFDEYRVKDLPSLFLKLDRSLE